MRALVPIIVMAVAGLAANGAYAAGQSCRIVHAAEMSMGSDEVGGVVVPMDISGQTVHLLVDTGGVLSMLTKSTVDKLGLPNSAMAPGRYFSMFGGQKIDHFSTAYDVDLGGLKIKTMRFAIMPDGQMPPGVDGTISPDILSVYDAEFDFANNKFYLNLQDHCPGMVVYWTSSPYAIIPMWTGSDGHVSVTANLDGKQIPAIVDTGSTRSYMSLDAAQSEFSLTEKDANLKREGSAENGYSYRYPFKMLALDGINISHPDLILVPDSKSQMMSHGGVRMILGMGILRQLHLYIAYNEAKIYATGASAH